MKYSLRLTFSLALNIISIRVSNHKSTSGRATLEIPRDDETPFPYSRCTRDDNIGVESKIKSLRAKAMSPHKQRSSWGHALLILRKCAQDDFLKRLSVAFTLLLLLSQTAFAQTATIPSGSGTSGDPYLISSLENLYWLSQSDTVWDDNAYFLQTVDIDASATSGWNAGAGFTPIGNITTAFTGSYDGGGFTIANLFINLSLAPRMGLFGRTNSATITNTGLVQADITGSVHTGALVGFAEAGSIIKNSYSSGSVSGNSNIGGLIGSSFADSVSQVYSLANVTTSGSNSGGLIGRQGTGVLIDSYAAGDVSGLNVVGGLVGLNQTGTSIENSYSTSLVTVVNSSVGGVVGQNNGTITNTYWDTETSGQSDGIGVDNNSQTVTGLTSSQMQFQSNFSGFDFSTTWGIANGFSEPYLQSLAPDSVAGHPTAWFPAGEGTSGNPYQIATLDNLFILSQEESLWNSDFTQTADIDASATAGWDGGAGFSPIGSTDSRFQGTYKGQGHTITGLTINRPSQRYIGFFGVLNNASVDSLMLIDVDITGLRFLGGLAGEVESTNLSDVFISGSINGGEESSRTNAGGIAGFANGGTLEFLISSADVTGEGSEAGGIFGFFSGGILTDSYSTGDVSGVSSIGGLIGTFQFQGSTEELHRVFATGTVTGNTSVGGLIGLTTDDIVITDSYATGNVIGSAKVGGFIGEALRGANISSSYATGTISGGPNTGGFIGTIVDDVSINNSYASGNVNGSSGVGSFIGYVDGNGVISNSYGNGGVDGSSEVGGFIGENDGTITNSYWNTQTSGQSNGIGTDNNGQTVTGLSIQEMAQQSNFSGFDFSGTWGIVEIFSEPYLQFNTPDSINGFAIADFPSGAGTEGDPIQISDLNDLLILSEFPSAWGSYFLQTADIDASATSGWNSGAGFSPIGTDGNQFDGNYDGNGRTISNLFINRPTESALGLFGSITNSEIQDLGVTDAQITGVGRVGALFGAAYGSTTITNTHSSGTVNGSSSVGGLGGRLESDSTATSNYSSASVTASSFSSGGLFGNVVFTRITDSYATGSVHGQSSAGGLIGDFPGANTGYLLRSFATGSVSGTSNIGGLVGFAAAVTEITDSYATGSVSGTNNVGGLIGNNSFTDVYTSYSNGGVSGSGTLAGLIGTNSGGTLTAAYWDTTASGQATGIGFDDNGQSATGLNSAQMQQISSFSGFDFSNTWGIANGLTEPFLRVFPLPDIADYPPSTAPSGSGTFGDPFLIASIENLYWLSQTDSVWNDNAYFQQTADIDASESYIWDSGKGFTPIGGGPTFTGSYDGDGYTISGVFIDRPNENEIGFFGSTNGAQVSNLGLTELQITSRDAVGAFSGTSGGIELNNVYVTGTITGTSDIGGLIGYTESAYISDSYSTADITASDSNVGGLIGYFDGDDPTGNGIIRSYSTGSITGDDYVGGLVGDAGNPTEIIDSYATGSVSGNNLVGGLTGTNSFDIQSSYSTASVSGTSNTGGLVGLNRSDGILTSTYWNTDSSGQSNGIGDDNNSQSPTGLSSSQMQFQSNFSGFDFSTTWGIVNGFSEPYLQNFAPDSVAGHPIAWFPAGEGTSTDPYQIATLDNLFILSQEESLWDSDFIQTADIDASPTAVWEDSAGFSPIGRDELGFRFEGTYKGKGHTITGLTIKRPAETEIGLFGDALNATIDSLNLVDLDFTGSRLIGGLAGSIRLTNISHIYTSGEINAVISTSSGSIAGGIVGSSGGDSEYLISSVNVSGVSGSVGGIFGSYSSGVLTDSYATGDVSGSGDIGGLIGIFEFVDGVEAVHRVYATGNVTGTLSDVGGLVGDLEFGAIVTDCYATGSVQGSSGDVGGLFGNVASSASISNCYASGSVSGGSDTGGFIGENFGNVTNSYWNTETSGQTDGIGTDNNSQTVTGLSTREMTQQSNFSGFDFAGTWSILNAFSEPYLQVSVPDSVNGFAFTDFPSGTGTEGDPILIETLTHLDILSQSSTAWNSAFLQTTDIDASATSGWNSGAGFIPIGESFLPFKGDYDGGGNEISNLFINRSSTSNVGFFGEVDSTTISNLGLVSADVTGSSNTGTLAGFVNNGSVIRNVYSTGSVDGGASTGGLIGISSADSVYKAYSTSDINSEANSTGGLIGTLTAGILTDSYAGGSVYGSFRVGGLVGLSSPGSIITNSYSTGSVDGSDSDFGGLIGGVFGSSISDSYWNTNLSGQNNAFGSGSGDATGLTTPQMTDSTHFSGFNFSESGAWNIDDGFTFPFLRELEEHRMVVATIDSGEGWRMIGNPGNVTYSELLDPLWTQGFTGADTESGSSNVYFYEESTQAWTTPSKASDYFGKADSNSVNTALNGILLYVYGDDDNDGNQDSWPKYIVSENAALNQSYTVGLGYTDNVSVDSAGWNLISNPYPVALDWTELVSNEDNTSTFPVAYVWDNTLNNGNGSYQVILGYPLPPGLTQDYLSNDPVPAMQSFWVKASATGASLDIKPDQQAASSQLLKQHQSTPEAETDTETSWLSLTVSTGDFSDQLVLFTSDAYKAPKLNTIASRYTEISIADTSGLWTAASLAGLEAGEQVTFPIHLSTTETGNFGMQWDGLDSFDDDWNFELIDHLTGESIHLSEGDSYSFDLEAGSAAKLQNKEMANNKNNELPLLRRGMRGGSVSANELGATRFELRVTVGTLVSEEPDQALPDTYALAQNYPNPFNPSTNIQFELPESGNVELLVFDILGRQVARLIDDRMEAGYHEIRFNASRLASGVYLYQLRARNAVITKKLTLIK